LARNGVIRCACAGSHNCKRSSRLPVQVCYDWCCKLAGAQQHADGLWLISEAAGNEWQCLLPSACCHSVILRVAVSLLLVPSWTAQHTHSFAARARRCLATHIHNRQPMRARSATSAAAAAEAPRATAWRCSLPAPNTHACIKKTRNRRHGPACSAQLHTTQKPLDPCITNWNHCGLHLSNGGWDVQQGT
jgi:hypothetical protein